MNINLFYDAREKNYYYVGNPVCNNCKKNIKYNLFLIKHWSRKNKPILETYCLNCLDKIKSYGYEVMESKPCVVVDFVPENTFPLFIQSPTLINSKGINAFQAAYVKNSEAEIIDHTYLAGRIDPNQDLIIEEIRKNKELLEKKDIELGLSPFLMIEERKNKIEEIRELKAKKAKINYKENKVEYDRLTEEIRDRAEEFNQELTKEFDFNSFIDKVLNSKLVIGQEDRKLLESNKGKENGS